jgi:flavin-dependent dehydrogenase
VSGEHAYEVLVVGGGPAGSTIALRLAQLGHHVCLVEAKDFPRHHIGEALSPGVGALLEFLGLTDAARDVGGLVFDAADICWGADSYERKPMDPRGFTVDRGRFDAHLLAAAQAQGAVLLQPAVAVEHVRTPTGWCVTCRDREKTFSIRANVLVDATGRRGFLPKSRTQTSPPTAALFGYWIGFGLPSRPRILAGPGQWYWGSPVPGSRFNAMMFIDRRDLRRRRGSAAQHYRDGIAALELGADAMAGDVSGCDATCYIDGRCAGADCLKVGEAAFAIDPLSSSGVQAAMQSALAGSVAVHTALLRPSSAIIAGSFYADHVRHVSIRHSRMSAKHYAEHRRHADLPFWRSRSNVVEHDAAPDPGFDIRFVPCAVDDFVELRPALCHASLPRPVAFVGGQPLISVKV